MNPELGMEHGMGIGQGTSDLLERRNPVIVRPARLGQWELRWQPFPVPYLTSEINLIN